jgi:PPP family 3-phenylpropionic acid transporter
MATPPDAALVSVTREPQNALEMAYEHAMGGPARIYAVRAAAFSASMFFCNGIYQPFFPLWLDSKHLGPSEISIVLAIPLVVRIVMAPAIVALADRLPSLRAASTIYAFLTAALFVAPVFLPSFWTILFFTGAALMFWSALGPFTDAVILYGVRQHGIEYPRVRLWGSAGFMLGSLAGAAAVQRFTGDVVLAVLVGSYFMAGVVALFSPPVPTPPPAAEKFGLKRAFADPVLRRALIAGTLVLGAHGVFYTFGTLFWQSHGFGGGLIGTLWAYSVTVEVTLFGLVKRMLPRWGARRFILAGGVAALIRWTLFPFATVPLAAFALQTLHGATFGMTHLGIMMAIGAVSTPGHTARLQAAYQFCHGSMMAAAMVAAGPLFLISPILAFFVAAAAALPSLYLANGLPRGLQPQTAVSGGETSAPE